MRVEAILDLFWDSLPKNPFADAPITIPCRSMVAASAVSAGLAALSTKAKRRVAEFNMLFRVLRSSRKGEKMSDLLLLAARSSILAPEAKNGFDKRLIDPACGDGRFIAGHRNAVGIEQDSKAANTAIKHAPWALIYDGDFFAWAAQTSGRAFE